MPAKSDPALPDPVVIPAALFSNSVVGGAEPERKGSALNDQSDSRSQAYPLFVVKVNVRSAAMLTRVGMGIPGSR